jgi:ABC-type multidrug transport system ATPase subunit
MKEVIKVSDISYKVKDKQIVSDICFNVEEGDSFALLGENGSGKSTLIDLILDDLKPNKGNVVFFNKKVRDYSKVGIVYDHLPLFPNLKVRESIKYFTVIHKLDFNTIKDKYFDAFSINKILESFVKELSQGERKRLGLLLSVIHNPDLLILDEPFANIDPTAIDRFWKVIRQDNRTVFFSTHNWTKAETLCTKVGFIFKGKMIIEAKSPKEILASMPSKTKVILNNNNEFLEHLADCKYYQDEDKLVVFIENNQLQLISKFTNNFSVQDVDLKDAYLYYTSNINEL